MPVENVELESTTQKNWTSEQQGLIDHWGSDCIAVAGAGAGKTSTVIEKIRIYLEKFPTKPFVAVSFTEKSAAELEERVRNLQADGELPKGCWVKTIHGFCLKIIQENLSELPFDSGIRVLSEHEATELENTVLNRLWTDVLDAETEEAFFEALGLMKVNALFDILRKLHGSNRFKAESFSNEPCLETLSKWFAQKYSLEKNEQGLCTFDDLEYFAWSLLQNAEIARRYSRKFGLLIVDEFQDTNWIQSEIIKSFCGDDLKNLVLVGDPKQSIYRFRAADVSLFAEWQNKVARVFHLSTNFRSRPEILNACNTICEPLFVDSPIPYEPLIPGRKSAEANTPVVYRIAEEGPSSLANWFLEKIEKKESLADTVILARVLSGVPIWLRQLMDANVPLAVESGGFFWIEPRTREVVRGLRGLFFPEDEFSLLCFLRAPWVAVSDQIIDQWKAEKISLWDGFLGSNHPLAIVLIPFFKGDRQACSVSEILELWIENPNLSDDLGASLLALWHLAELAARQGHSRYEILDEWTQNLSNGLRAQGVPPPTASDLVRVMTIHSSKGLEFDRVILVNFDEKVSRAKSLAKVIWDREHGVFVHLGDHSPEDQLDIWKKRESKKELDEAKRVFYVALTRAKEELIFCAPDRSEEFKEKGVKANSIHWRSWIEPIFDTLPVWRDRDRRAASLTLRNRLADRKFSALKQLSEVQPSWVRPRHSVSEWVKMDRCPRSFKVSLIRRMGLETEDLEDELSITEVEKINEAQQVGTKIHGILEAERFEETEELGDFRNAIQKWKDETDIFQSIPDIQVFREWAFEIAIGPGVLVGALDRWHWNPATQVAQVFDYKVSRGTYFDPGAHTLQLQLYGAVLQRMLPPEARVLPRVISIQPSGVREWPVAASGEPKLLEKYMDFASQLYRDLEWSQVSANPGSYCKLCPLHSSCPEEAERYKLPV